MNKLIKLTIVSALALFSLNANAEEAPAKKDIPAVKTELTGSFVELNDKVRFVDQNKKKYIVVKKVLEEAKKHLNKNVTVVCKVKSKKDKKGNDMHMIVYINKVTPAAEPEKEPAKSE